MNKENQSFLAAEKVGKLMMKYSVPCIISLPVSALYNIVDQIFIQKIAEESGFTAEYICAALLRLFRGEKKRIHGYCIE